MMSAQGTSKPKLTATEKPVVAVIGMGYVGLPLALAFGEADCPTIGIDTDPSKIEQLRLGQSYIEAIPCERISRLVESQKLCPTTDYQQIRKADAVILCVPTPLTDSREPDLGYIVKTSQAVCGYLQPGQLVILESTTYPGTTQEVVLPLLEKSGLCCPANGDQPAPQKIFHLAFSPERIDPGNTTFKLREIPKVVGGINLASTTAASTLYQEVFDSVVEVSTTQVAEMTKLLENIYRSVNIALVNELKLVCSRLGIDLWEAIDAAATKPYGFQPFYPGPGLGGHCIPIDPFYLTWKARQVDIATKFIELAGEVNVSMPDHVVRAVMEALNHQSKPIKDSRILILGVAYKRDVDDVRESPALRIIHLLNERGAQVSYNDPHIPQLPPTRRYDFSHMSSVELTPAAFGHFDCVIVVTDHSAYDYHEIVNHAQLVIDTRNATRGAPDPLGKVVRC